MAEADPVSRSPAPRFTRSEPPAGHANRIEPGEHQQSGEREMKGLGLWLLGVPIVVIIALYVFGVL